MESLHGVFKVRNYQSYISMSTPYHIHILLTSTHKPFIDENTFLIRDLKF